MVKKLLFSLAILMSFTSVSFAQLTPPNSLQTYYNGVDFTLTNTNLYNELATLTISKHSNHLTYSERHDYLYDADEDLNNANNVVLVYSGTSVDKREYQSGNNSHSPQTFNTEHIYPRSLIGNTAEADLHHLRSCTISINSSRLNHPFTDGTGSYQLINGNSWYPGDEWKGDVARMILYMNLRYNENFNDVGALNLFLKWNVEDPVSDFEKNRNNVIENVQGNRNPFIDNPYLATLIWGGDMAENTWGVTASTDDVLLNQLRIYPNPATANKINVKIPNGLNIKQINLYSILGKQIKTISKVNTNNQIIENIPTGLYLLQIISEKGQLTKKVIVN